MHRTFLAALMAASAWSALGCAPRPAPVVPPATLDLIVAATTDVHGRLRGWEYYADAADSARGLTRAATIVDSLRDAHPGRVVLLDAGDLLQGNPLAYVAARVSADTMNPVVAAMNAMRYDAAAIGNHEFNYGVPYLRRAIAQARFPFLAANARAIDGGAAFERWTMIERGGAKIAIIGATTPGSMVWDRDNLRGKVMVDDIVPAVRASVREARERGADVVLVTVHSGLDGRSSYDTVGTGLPSENVGARLAREVDGIDVMVIGHSHREIPDTTIGRTLIVQPKNWATSVAVAHVLLERPAGGAWSVTSRRGTIVPAAGHAEHAGVLAATDRAHRETVAYVTTPIGSTPVAWRADSSRVRDTPLIDFMLEIMRGASKADLAATAAFSLDASLDAGPITIAELARLYPYDNTLRAVRVSGRQVREFLEHSARYYNGAGETPAVDPTVPGYNFDIIAGADYTLDLTKPLGQRVTRLMRNGRPLADSDSVTLALNNYRQTGGGGFAMLAGAPLVYDEQQEIRQLLIEEVQRRDTIRPADYFRQNWTLSPPAAAAAAYEAMSRTVRAEAAGGRAEPAGQRPGTTRLRILATNDFHGALEPRPDAGGVQRGGAAARSTLIQRLRGECVSPACETIVLDGGDMWQGTPASNLAFGKPVVAIYDHDGYAAAALGNHEFDWGAEVIRERMAEARFKILGANVRYADGTDVEWIPNDTLVRRGALTIGVIGLATMSTPTTTRAANVAGLRFDAPAPIVDSIARALRARGAGVVIVIAHAGGFCDRSGTGDCSGEIFDLARKVTQPIDAIVSGHTHALVNSVVAGIPIVQARSRGTAVGVIDLELTARTASGTERASRPLAGVGLAGRVVDVLPDSLPAHPVIDTLVRRAVSTVAGIVNRPVATFAAAMHKEGEQFALGNYIADAQRFAGKADVAVMNNGGIRTGIRAGPATYGTLFEVQPFGNTLYKLTLSGAELRAYLERLLRREPPHAHVSGVVVTYDVARPLGSRIVSARMADGRALRDDATYTLVINDFMVTGGDGLGLAERGITAVPLNIVDLDALMDYSRSRPQPVAPPTAPRFVKAGP